MSATAFPPSSPPDALEALVARMTRGDQAALAELHDATSSRVFGTCMRILGEPAAAEEAAMDAYLQAWRSASAFNAERGSVLAWLVMMARSRALDARRSRERADTASRAEALPSPVPGPDEEAGRSIAAGRVRAALAALPKEQAEAVAAAFYGGLSHAEIAAALGQPLGTIKTRIRTGLLRLRRALDTEMMDARS